MSRRSSQRLKRPSAVLKDNEQQQSKRKRQVQIQSDEQPKILKESDVEALVDKVTNAVIAKLQNSNVCNNSAGNQGVLQKSAPAVQGSVDAALSNSNNVEAITVEDNDSVQAKTAAAAVQGSVAAVLDTLCGKNNISKPQNVFMSSDIPIDLSVTDKLKKKIWANEYIDFGMLLNNKREHTHFNLCLSNDTSSLNGQPIIPLEPNQKPKNINSIDMWIAAYQVFVGVYAQKYSDETPSLMKYSEIIRDLATRGYNWRYYDENFRYMRQQNPKAYPWGSVHWELWIRSQPPRSLPRPSKKFDGDSKSGIRVPKGYCWKYHKGLSCGGCAYKHSCPLCEKSHTMINCHNFRPSKGKPVASNMSTPNSSKSKPT